MKTAICITCGAPWSRRYGTECPGCGAHSALSIDDTPTSDSLRESAHKRGRATIAALRDVLARLERAEEDSRRLDWIFRNLGGITLDSPDNHDGPWTVESRWNGRPYAIHRGATPRDAIDAARKETEK